MTDWIEVLNFLVVFKKEEKIPIGLASFMFFLRQPCLLKPLSSDEDTKPKSYLIDVIST